MLSERDKKRIEKDFTYHPSKEWQLSRYIALRDMAKGMAYLVCEACPEGRERSLALTALEEMVMWANAAIARNE